MHVSKSRQQSIASFSDSSLFDQSVSSVISELTIDEDDTFEMSSRFGPTLKSTPYLDRVRMTSSSRFCTSISPSTESNLCVMPKRKSSSLDEHDSDYYNDSLQGMYQTTGTENPSSSQDLSDRMFENYGCPSLSLDLDDIFEERICSDVSPQIVKRKSSLLSIAASAKKAELFMSISDSSSSGDERFQVACPKEKTNSMAMPSRRMSSTREHCVET